MENRVWIIGVGSIGSEYAKILNTLHVNYTAIGRGKESACKFKDTVGHDVITGGLSAYLENKPSAPIKAIVAVRTPDLAKTTIELIKYGVKEILCEKPGFMYPEEIDGVVDAERKYGSKVFIAYNRRFYSSTLKAEKIIKEDGGVTSFNFEFTEWISAFANRPADKLPFRHFFTNSTHVVDLAFFLGGYPKEISCYTNDKFSWHNPAIFAGAGISQKGALFSYQANWKSPGRWAVEILTPRHRLYFKPMETLQIQEMNSVKVTLLEIDDKLDKEFKPGFFLQTQAFISGDYSRICTLEEQAENVKKYYMKIGKPSGKNE